MSEKHYRVRFEEVPLTAVGDSVKARTVDCWVCEALILTFDTEAEYFLCEGCHKEATKDSPYEFD